MKLRGGGFRVVHVKSNLYIKMKAWENHFIMPRHARVKNYDPVYHIIAWSISEVPISTCSADKDMYLRLMK